MRINEIFYSLQGEGFHVGTPSIFIRFSGCNLNCPFCDTQHQDGREMDENEIIEAIRQYPARHVVLTGGEPSLQLTASLIDALHQLGKFVAIETNGTHCIPSNIDWITLSPKDAFVTCHAAQITLHKCNEIKVIFNGNPLPDYSQIACEHRFIQPCDTGHDSQNSEIIQGAIAYCLEHPDWSLSLQTHKLIGIK